MRKLKPGDRVKGIHSHRQKVGTVIEVGDCTSFICVKWDGGKRKSWVESIRLAAID